MCGGIWLALLADGETWSNDMPGSDFTPMFEDWEEVTEARGGSTFVAAREEREGRWDQSGTSGAFRWRIPDGLCFADCWRS